MAEPLRKPKAPAKIVLHQARAGAIRSSLKIASDKVHAHAAIVAVKRAAKPKVKAAKTPATLRGKKSAAATLRRVAVRTKARGGKV